LEPSPKTRLNSAWWNAAGQRRAQRGAERHRLLERKHTQQKLESGRSRTDPALVPVLVWVIKHDKELARAERKLLGRTPGVIGKRNDACVQGNEKLVRRAFG
jgi:hypothetical protein